MSAYFIALYIHLLALVAASATSGVVHLAHARARRASSVPEVRQWLMLGGSTARMFPIATLTLLATGGFMVGIHGSWSWGAGWVVAGLVGVVFLLLSGPVLGVRGARVGRALAGLGPSDIEGARAAMHDRIAGALSWINTGVALAVVFDMAAKPGLVTSLSALLVGAAGGLATQLAFERRAARAPAPAAARQGLAA